MGKDSRRKRRDDTDSDDDKQQKPKKKRSHRRSSRKKSRHHDSDSGSDSSPSPSSSSQEASDTVKHSGRHRHAPDDQEIKEYLSRKAYKKVFFVIVPPFVSSIPDILWVAFGLILCFFVLCMLVGVSCGTIQACVSFARA